MLTDVLLQFSPDESGVLFIVFHRGFIVLQLCMSCYFYSSIISTELLSHKCLSTEHRSVCLYQYFTFFLSLSAELVFTLYVAMLIYRADTSTETRAYRGVLCTDSLTHIHKVLTHLVLQWHSVFRGVVFIDVPCSHVYCDAITVYLGTSHLGVSYLQRTCSYTCCIYRNDSVMAQTKVSRVQIMFLMEYLVSLTMKALLWLQWVCSAVIMVPWKVMGLHWPVSLPVLHLHVL